MPRSHAQPVRAPLPHQATTLQWAKNKKAVALFHEMRLGKTYTTINWLKQNAPTRAARLVVAPLSVLPAWQAELQAEGERGVLLVGSQEDRLRKAERAIKKGWWALVNWDGLRTRANGRSVESPLCMLDWEAVVLDESTRIRNPKAVTTKIVQRCLADAEYRAVLSGLPNPQTSLDLFEQMRFVSGSVSGCTNYWRFRHKHFQIGFDGFSWRPKPGAAERILEDIADDAHVLSRKQAGLGNRKIFERRYVSLPGRVRRAMEQAEREWAVGTHETSWNVVRRAWLAELCGGRSKQLPEYDHDAKLKELADLLGGELRGEPVVVWFRYRREIDAASRYVYKHAGVFNLQIHGGVPVDTRKKSIAAFQAGQCPALFCQMQTLKYGVDLSRSSTSIYYSMTDDPEDFYQSLDRVEHPKKKEPLLYVMLLVKDSVDEDRFNSLQRKGIDSKSLLRSLRAMALERSQRCT